MAADQFGVDRLKKLCEKKILVSINTENAATILQVLVLVGVIWKDSSCIEWLLLELYDASYYVVLVW